MYHVFCMTAWEDYKLFLHFLINLKIIMVVIKNQFKFNFKGNIKKYFYLIKNACKFSANKIIKSYVYS